jgi:hypothetical protein
VKRALHVLLAVAIALPLASSGALAVTPTSASAVVPSLMSKSATAADETAASSVNAPAPLVVLMDISGSMADSVPASNGSGSVVKLDAAKTALKEPISNAPPGTDVGIWTFPGGPTDSNGCDPGGWLVNVNSGDSATTVLQNIDGLSANGDTPTGPALTDVVNSLKARGIYRANILLVSDGLFNCGTDPCEVAKGLAGSGFTVTIQTVGFNISDDGGDDLKCMAAATGGNYFDASDGADLDRIVNQLTTPQLTVKVNAPEHPIAGQTTTIEATVTNKSAFDGHDAQIRLGFGGAQPDLLVPQIPSSLINVGTIPAGQSVSRSWTFVAGQPGLHQRAYYSVSASSIEALPVQVGGTFITDVPGLEAADAGSILSGLVKNKESLAILGDSYSSGEGTLRYLPAINGVAAACHRSPDTYLAPEFTAAKVDVAILACSGATTTALLDPQIDSSTGATTAGPQLDQLRSLSTVPGAAVLTIGGNDINFKDIVTQCIMKGNAACNTNASWGENVLGRPAAIESRLVQAYEDTWLVLNQPSFLSARGGQYAPVIVLDYPQVVHNAEDGACPINDEQGFDTEEVKFADQLEGTLNNAIQTAALTARTQGFGVYGSDATSTAFLPNHSVCASASQRWVNQILGTIPNLLAGNADPETMHPTPAGYSAETDAIIEWSKTVRAVSVSQQAKALAAAKTIFDEVPSVQIPFSADALSFAPKTSTVVAPGQSVFVNVKGFGDLPVLVSVHSQAVLLGGLRPDTQGRVRAYFVLPADVAYGAHRIVVQGWNKQGKPIVDVADITVKPPTPIWVYVIGGLSLLLVLAAVVFAVRFRRRGRKRASPNDGRRQPAQNLQA